MKLIVFGDSFVEGLLKHPTRSTIAEGHEISFVARLGEMLGCEVENRSMAGNGNDGIAYDVYKWLRDTDIDPDVFVMVVWSTLNRTLAYNPKFDRMDYENRDDALSHPNDIHFKNEIEMAGIHELLKSKNINHLMTQSFFNHLSVDYPHVITKNETRSHFIEWSQTHNTLFDIIDDKWLSSEGWTPMRNHTETDIRSQYIAECQHPTPLGHIKIAETLLPYIERKIYGNDDPHDPFIYR